MEWADSLSGLFPALPQPWIQTSAELQPPPATVQPEPEPMNGVAPSVDGQSYSVGNANRFWARAEYLLWGIKDGNVPPLATSSTVPLGGQLGAVGTTTLFSGDQNYNARHGGRFTIGTWLDDCQTTGIEGSYFFLNGSSDNFNASSTGAPGSDVLARPFFNVITGLQDRQLIASPGVSSGTIGISSSSQLQGANLNMLCNLCCCGNECGCCQTDDYVASGYRMDLISGFRFLQLNEDLVIAENITGLAGGPLAGQTINVVDRFSTRNNFYGGQVGARTEYYRGPWFVNVSGSVALGSTHQEVEIRGTSTFTPPGVTQPGGLLALPTNIGNYSRDKFTVVPEIGINVGRQLTKNLRAYVGYNFIYWSSVVRPGDQIDPVINPTQIPTAAGPGTLVGPARPAFAFHDTDFWAQGINFGVAFSF